MAPTRWETRDLPFLRVAAERLDTAVPALIATQLADEVGLTPEECFAAARALVQADYLVGNLTGSQQGLNEVILTGLTERGRRAVGIWPAGTAPRPSRPPCLRSPRARRTPSRRDVLDASPGRSPA